MCKNNNCGCCCDPCCGNSGGGSFGELTVSSIPGLFETTVTSPSNNPNVHFDLEAQDPYTVYARGTGTGQPSFQKLVPNHIPGLPASKIISGIFPPDRLGTGLADPTTVLHGDGVWRTIIFPPVDGFITTNTTQVGLTGNKTTAGLWTYSSLSGTGTRIAGLSSSGTLKFVNLDSTLSFDEITNTLSANIPLVTGFITTSTDQIGLTGNKTTSGTWTYSSLSGVGTRLAAVSSTGELKSIVLGSLLAFDEPLNTLNVAIPILRTFYVDVNNPVAGDGSILNPFNSLILAVNTIIGSGSRTSPQFNNITVKVASGAYSFSDNLCIQGVTWIFDEGATITYSGGGYVIDTTALTTMPIPFKFIGYPTININSGGFIKNHGIGVSAQFNRYVYAEIGILNNNTPLGAGHLITPLIHLVKTDTGTAYNPPQISLVVKTAMTSIHKTVAYIQGCARINIKGTASDSRINFSSQATATGIGHIIRYEGGFSETLSTAYTGGIIVKDIILGSGRNCDAIYIEGFYGTKSGFYNVFFSDSYGGAFVNTLITFGDIRPGRWTSADDFCEFIVTNCIVDSSLGIVDEFQIKFTGVTVPSQNQVVITGNLFKNTKKIDPGIDYAYKSTVYNIVNSYLQIKGAPEYQSNAAAVAAGLVEGDVYKTSDGDLKIVI